MPFSLPLLSKYGCSTRTALMAYCDVGGGGLWAYSGSSSYPISSLSGSLLLTKDRMSSVGRSPGSKV